VRKALSEEGGAPAPNPISFEAQTCKGVGCPEGGRKRVEVFLGEDPAGKEEELERGACADKG